MRIGPAGRARGESGSILVQVAAMMVVITALSVLVVDYGVHVVSRTQIQGSADSAAIAAATALAFEDFSDRTSTGPAVTAAIALSDENPVVQERASTNPEDVTFPACDSAGAPPDGCVQVTAYRTRARSNPIPLFLGAFVGLTDYDVSGSATAAVMAGNGTDCLKPLSMPDRWTEVYPSNPNSGAWDSSADYDRYAQNGTLRPADQRDVYAPPSSEGAGTGLTVSDFFGVQVALEVGGINSPVAPISPWDYLPVQIPGSQWGDNAVRQNTNSCAASPVGIGTELPLSPGGPGTYAQQVADGMRDLINLDPGAYWDTSTQRVEGSCAESADPCGSMSPRIVAVALYDPTALADQSATRMPTSVVIRNLIGLFIEQVDGAGNTVRGRIMRHPGQVYADATTLSDASSFMRTVALVK